MVYTTHYRIGQRQDLSPSTSDVSHGQAWRSYPLHGRLRNAATLEPNPGIVKSWEQQIIKTYW